MKTNILPRMRSIIFLSFCLLVGLNAQAAEKLKPYILVSNAPGDHAQILADTRAKLEAAGFEIVGEYSPYEGADIIAITSDELKSTAAKTEMGGFGAVQRVTVTTVGDNVQVAYTNPRYMANVYRMEGELDGIADKLTATLGEGQQYGAEGLTAKELRKYHYMVMMPYFDDPYELGEFDSYEAAIQAVEAGLGQTAGGVSKVYRVDIPGKNETVYGVHMTEDCSGDKFIMEKIDFAGIKSTPHLPYEVLVSDNKVLALHAKFRIAQSFPDLKMVGSNSFVSIMCAPDAIDTALTNMLEGSAAAAQ